MKTLIILALFALTVVLLISVESNKQNTEIDKIYEKEYVDRHTKS